MRWSLIAVTLSATIAHAEPAPEYPLAVVDRPILMYANTTELQLSIGLPTYTSYIDEMGNSVMKRTHIGDDRVLEFGAIYSFGTLELSAAIASSNGYSSTGLGARTRVGDSGSVGLSVDLFENGSLRALSQTLGYGHRLRVPGRLLLTAGASARVSEVWTTPRIGATAYSTELSASVFGSVTLQLVSRLAIGVYPGVNLPIADSAGPRGRVSVGEMTQLTFSLRRWDFFAQFGLFDLTRQRRQYAGAGVLVRF